MRGEGGIVVLVIIAAVGIVFAIFSAKWRRERMEALERLAHSLGWTFSAGPFAGGGGLFSGRGRAGEHPYALFDLFDSGRDREFSNVMHGGVVCSAPEGEPPVNMVCEAGDFSWVTGSGKSRRTHRVSYLLFDVSRDVGATPWLVIRPEGFSDRIMAAFGGEDIDFESEEFSRRFHVTSSNRQFAFAVIDPRMMEYLLGYGSVKVCVNAGWGLIVSGSERWDPDEFKGAVRWARGFVEHWPRYLIKQLRQDSL